MARWHIEGYENGRPSFDAWLSGRLSNRQIAQILVRLQSRHLTDREVVEFSMRSTDRDRLSELVVPVGGGFMTALGGSDFYTARFEEPTSPSR